MSIQECKAIDIYVNSTVVVYQYPLAWMRLQEFAELAAKHRAQPSALRALRNSAAD